MPRNGSGQYNPLTNTWNPPVTGVLATGADFQAQLNDISAAITQSVSKDGQTPMTANLPMGNNSIVGIASGTETSPSISANGDTNTGLYFPAADTVAIATGGVKRVEVDASGNVGVGVTPSAWGATYRALDVRTGAVYDTPAGTASGFTFNAIFNGTNWVYKGTGGNATAVRYEQGFGQHQWFTALSGTAGNPITFTQAMTLNSDGNLLVNTTSNMAWTGGSSSANKLQLGGSRPIALNTDDGSINYKANTGGWAMGSYFYGSSGTYRGGFGAQGDVDTLNYYWVGTAYNGTGALLTYGNNSWSALSDEREKTVHGNIENAVEKIKNIRAVYFNYNTDEPSVRRRAGFIAQDFQNVFPEIVQEIDRSDVDATEEVKRLVMSYSETTPLLLAAIKEQQALIEAQKTAIESLTARITALEAK